VRLDETLPLNDIGHSSTSRWRILTTTLGPFLALMIVIVFFAACDHGMSYAKGGGRPATFLTLQNARLILVQTLTVAIAALGMTLVIIAGGIDLSAGVAVSLSATVVAWCLRENHSPAVAVLAGLATGCATGFLNGSLISLLRVVPFIVTLGTMRMFLGLGNLIAKETTLRPSPKSVPDWIPALVKPTPQPEWLVFSTGVWLLLGLAVVASLLLRRTVFGRYIFAIGSNEATARLCGVNVPWTKIAVYTASGLFVGLAGVMQFARLSSGNPPSGVGLELRIIAAVVIGGGSLSGGRGSVLGTLTGAAIMQVLASGCTILGLPNPYQDIIVGVIVVVAVILDQVRQRRLEE
jgi:ribose transport system permease protein